MKTLIIYYSESGSTQKVAETLAIKLECDLCRVKDLKKRTGFKNKITSSIDAFRENKTEIYPESLNLQEYNTIYFGTPTWANNPAPAIITMIDRCDLRGKDIVLFATMTGKGGQAAIKRMQEKVEARGARVIETFSLKTKDKTLAQIQEDSENIAKLLDLSLYK